MHQFQKALHFLFNFKADVIVNTIGIDLDLNIGGVSKGILKEAGEGIQKECNMQCKRASYGKVIVTSSGNIQSCKAIFHGSLPYWTPSGQFSLKVLMSFVYDCLNLASARNYNSIAFPSMGTGKLEYPKREVATAMWDAVEMFSQKNPTSSVKKVTFVLFRSDAKVIPVSDTIITNFTNCLSRAVVMYLLLGASELRVKNNYFV
ncbi:hypothetical protein FSP39_013789 [Pinctada imbricata]|uniref:Macro domain-containing protein n=1 Tax=Pinctada imbricata TaxID=66713 RepID=A0AA89C852_PINIB|nr:hypothetical protein FSP39_013789 [Pinctada imbricata]